MLLRLSCVVLGQAAVVRDFKWVHNFLATCPSKHFTWKFTLCVVLNQNVCPHASSYQWQWPGFEIEHELHYLGPFKNSTNSRINKTSNVMALSFTYGELTNSVTLLLFFCAS